MFEKFNHRFKGNPYYNFFTVFVGLFFAIYMVLPDGWHRPLPLLVAASTAAIIAVFAASSPEK